MAEAHTNSQGKRRAPRWARPAVDAGMALVYLLQMAPYATGSWYHELAGAAFFLLFLAHHVLNAGWMGRARKRGDARATLTLVLDLALTACVFGIIASGLLMSRHVAPALAGLGLTHIARPLHAFCTYAGLMLVALHTGLHAPVLRGYARRLTSAKPAPQQQAPSKLLLAVPLAVSLALGTYAALRLNVPAKLSFGMSFPDGSTPLPLLLLLHLALAAPFFVLGAAASQRRQ